MKRIFFMLAISAVTTIFISSCSSNRPIMYVPYGSDVATTGSGGTDTGVGVVTEGKSDNSYDLVPVGDRIEYTIDIGQPEGQQKLQGLSLAEAKQLAFVEASRKYNCDRLIDPRYTYKKSEDGKRILRITVDGRPGNYKMKSKK